MTDCLPDCLTRYAHCAGGGGGGRVIDRVNGRLYWSAAGEAPPLLRLPPVAVAAAASEEERASMGKKGRSAFAFLSRSFFPVKGCPVTRVVHSKVCMITIEPIFDGFLIILTISIE